MNLTDYKGNFFQTRSQFIILNNDGTVKESLGALVKIGANETITKIHPFFESMIQLLKAAPDNHSFKCIHLGKEDEFVCDIDLSVNKEESLLVIHDFTDHYKEYQNVAQSRNESVITSQILDLQNQYLKEKEEFKNKFIANFSHEIRNPLTSVLTFCQMLEKTDLDLDQQDYVNVIQSATDDLRKILEDILDLSKIEAGKLSLEIDVFDIHEELELIKFIYSAKCRQRQLEFHCKIDEKIPRYVEGDKHRFKQVLVNLLENAMKFTHEGSITLKVQQNFARGNRTHLHFEIIDTGVGIPKDKLEDVFESFTQAHDSNKYKGTGLGLTIVKELLHMVQSEIKVESEENKGTTFSFNLVLKFPFDQELEKPKSESKKAKYRKPANKKKFKVLLVEDIELTQMIVLKILAKTGAFYLDILSHGQDVIETLKHEEYDLILMDIKIPGTQGDEVSRQIRAMGFNNTRNVPILALTAHHKPDDLKVYKKSGIDDVVRKPFDEESLLNTMYKYLPK
ncbi:hybrid sensor histidine kinase/response regulator [Sungkyunkwania multivorans]|uniref:histidine kinase n=1 Tax=Sungkyunkwania multivorans TaxID=1173618 RepID=A0ABW3CUD8_9FLAO